MYGKGLKRLSIATVATIAAAIALVFFYAPIDADQGFIQKIFYLHVPLAITALVGFVARRRLRDPATCARGDRTYDARSYVAIHISIVFGLAVLLTGSIWAKASWGHWWVWDEPTLVSFLIVFLLYATYYPFRYAIEDPDRQARYASVFAITAGAFVPLNFLAVRLAESLVHPRVFATTGGGLPGKMMADLPRLPRRDRAAVDHPGPLRADREERFRPGRAGCAARSTPPGPRPRRPRASPPELG